MAELTAGCRIKDNDPRMPNRVLTVVEVLKVNVLAENGMGRVYTINRKRIFTDGKPRRTGFSLVPDASGVPVAPEVSTMSNDVAAERERCATLCEELACMVDDGAGAVGRLWQAARNIRQGKQPGNFYPGRKEPTNPRDPDAEARELRDALRWLHSVCTRMDAENEGERPDEREYQAAMAEAAAALGVQVGSPQQSQRNEGGK